MRLFRVASPHLVETMGIEPTTEVVRKILFQNASEVVAAL